MYLKFTHLKSLKSIDFFIFVLCFKIQSRWAVVLIFPVIVKWK